LSHLESVIAEFYDWKGFVVRRNIKVGRLQHGGWEGELDVVAFDHHSGILIHLEPSIDAHSWAKREERFSRKFSAGRKYIFSAVYPWLDPSTPIKQVAILPSHPKGRDSVGGGEVWSIDEFMLQVRRSVSENGKMAKHAIPELYPLLRTVQLTEAGYYRAL
jgi:hypothetical protein